MKISITFLALFIILIFISPANAQNCQASKDLPNFGCVNKALFRGAQPTEDGIEELARRGVKTIINLRKSAEKARLEEAQARKFGIKFISLPLSNWFSPKNPDIERVMKLIDASENQPVFIHCQKGADRTGTVIAVYRITHNDWTATQAKKEAKAFRFGWWQFWMKNYIEDYYEDYTKQKANPASTVN